MFVPYVGVHALIEMGSTAFRCIVVDGAKTVTRRSVHLHLGAVIGSVGHFRREDIATTLQHTRELTRVANDYGVRHPTIIATEAFRAAGNGTAVLDHIGREIDQTIQLLSGSEQAALALHGALDALPHLESAVVADLGGGALCLAAGRAGAARVDHVFTHQLGVSLLAPSTMADDQLPPSVRTRLEAHITDELRPVERSLAGEPARPFVVTGGWARAIGQLVHTSRRGEVPSTTHGLTIDCADLGHIITTTSDLPTAARLAMPGMKARRAALMPLAATVFRQTLRALGGHEATVSDAGVADALLTQRRRADRAAA